MHQVRDCPPAAGAGPIEIRAPFRHSRRGVETWLVLGGPAVRAPDLVMLRRIRRAMNWVDRIKAGETVGAIADSEGVSTSFITNNIDFAFLSPEILGAILVGRQRPELTTRQLTRQHWPVDWSQQSRLFLA